jgi:hypothetical protein
VARPTVRKLAWASFLVLGISAHAHAQTVGSSAPDGSGKAGPDPPSTSAPEAEKEKKKEDGSEKTKEEKKKEDGSEKSDSESDKPKRTLLERICASVSHEEDDDGPINTDRPTFTPANTVVPRGRLQFESGFTFNSQQTPQTRSSVYDFPELAMRYGLTKRLEFRTFWLGSTSIQTQSRAGGPWSHNGGYSDMEVGFKWQLLEEDKERKWIPTTALITSVMAPTGGASILSSQEVNPYINLIYGWNLTDKLTLAGSTGYLGMRQQPTPGSGRAADSFERYHQSLVAFFSATERTTLFYEWYVFMYTNAADNRPAHFMDGGLLHRLTPNIQLDLRAGLGLSGHPDDFFTGAGFSVRF